MLTAGTKNDLPIMLLIALEMGAGSVWPLGMCVERAGTIIERRLAFMRRSLLGAVLPEVDGAPLL